MKVRNLMESKGTQVVSIEPEKSVDDAIMLMNANKISAIVVNEDGKTVGIFTERDVVRCYVSKGGRKFREIPVSDAMTKNLIVAEQDDDISDIMCIMVEKNIRHLPVVDKGRVIGMLSIRDIIQAQVSKLNAEIHYLKDYITGY